MKYGNTLTRKIYYNSPYFFKNIMTSTYGYLHSRRVHSKNYKNYFKFLLDFQYWPNDKAKQYQWEKTRDFIKYAYENTVFYNRVFKERGLTPSDIQSPEDMQKLPIINKHIVNKYKKDIIPRNIKSKDIIWTTTSGTTGSSLTFPMSIKAYKKAQAIRELQYIWVGLPHSLNFKKAIIAGHPVAYINRNKPPFWAYDFINKDMYFSSYHLSDKNIISYIKKLEKFSPKLILGYPSSIYLIAQKIDKVSSAHTIKPEAIITSSETLLEYQRKAIQSAFGCKIYDFYGNAEGCGEILTCEYELGHMLLCNSYVEILASEMIVTNFNNHAFPLIRYKINDSIKIFTEGHCECGRNGILIEEIKGRIEDYVMTPDNRKIGRLDHIFKDALHVKEAQIYQSNKNEISLRIVKADGYNNRDEKLIIKEARERLGDKIKISFEYIEEIHRAKNGKIRFVISKVPYER